MDNILFKWCNCYQTRSDIYVVCYDTDIQAVNEFEKLEIKNEKIKKEQSEDVLTYDQVRLVKLSKIMPNWVNAFTVRRAFRPTVNFIPNWWHQRVKPEETNEQ